MDIKNDIIKIAKSDTIISKFTYCKEFFDKWQSFLERAYNSNTKYVMFDIEDKDQCYMYSLLFGNQKIDFHFSIKYLRDFLKYCIKNNATITKIQLDNIHGKLLNGAARCYYNECDTLRPSSVYKDLDDIIVIPMPAGEYAFLIADGNHRVCSQINENKNIINATYLDYKIAAHSLNTPFEIAFYCFIEDFEKIRYNLIRQVGKISDSKVNKILNINNPERALYLISKR